jgi:hypothetical protein
MKLLKINLLLYIFFFCSNCLFAQTQSRDIVEMKNGSVIKGSMLELVMDGSIKIETADGSLFIFKAEEVFKVTKEKIAVAATTPPAPKVAAANIPNADESKKSPENIGTSVTTEPLTAVLINKGIDSEDDLFCDIKVENLTDKDITGIQGYMYIFDESGKKIHSFFVYINSDNVEIKGREIKTIHLKDDYYNQFQEEDRLFKNTDIGKLKYKWEVKQVVFSDGTAFDKQK